MADENRIQVVTAQPAKRTLTQKGLLNALWVMIAEQPNHRAVLKRGLLTGGIPSDAVLKVEYFGADDVYRITAARQRPDSAIAVPN